MTAAVLTVDSVTKRQVADARTHFVYHVTIFQIKIQMFKAGVP